MGLKVHSLGELPPEASRGYFVYLLDYGWEEPLGRALRDNFDRMAEAASRNDAAVLLGVGNEFNDEVLSWHDVNGRPAGELLPAILITNKHPDEFRRMNGSWSPSRDHLVVIPLRDRCKTETDVAQLIDGIFADIRAKRPLANFGVARRVITDTHDPGDGSNTYQNEGVNGLLLRVFELKPESMAHLCWYPQISDTPNLGHCRYHRRNGVWLDPLRKQSLGSSNALQELPAELYRRLPD